MTNEQAREYFEKCNADLLSGVLDENRDLTIFENRTYQANQLAIQALTAVCDIDAIRAEIEILKVHGIDNVSISNNYAIDEVLQIIDKYTNIKE